MGPSRAAHSTATLANANCPRATICGRQPALTMLHASLIATGLGSVESVGQTTSWFLRSVTPQVIGAILLVAFLATLALVIYYRWLVLLRHR